MKWLSLVSRFFRYLSESPNLMAALAIAALVVMAAFSLVVSDAFMGLVLLVGGLFGAMTIAVTAGIVAVSRLLGVDRQTTPPRVAGA